MRYLYLPPRLPVVKPCVSRPHSAPAQGWEGGKSRQRFLRQRWRLKLASTKSWETEGVRAFSNPRGELLLFLGVLVQKVRSFLKLKQLHVSKRNRQPPVDRYPRYRVLSSGKAEPVSDRGISPWRALSPAPCATLLPRLMLSLVYRSPVARSI